LTINESASAKLTMLQNLDATETLPVNSQIDSVNPKLVQPATTAVGSNNLITVLSAAGTNVRLGGLRRRRTVAE
jgi:hypothetical protein